MKLRSSNQITKPYNIDEVIGEKIKVMLIDISSETKEETIHEGETIIEYIYDAFQVELMNNETYIVEHYDTLLVNAKENEKEYVAYQVRQKRQKLLEETDNFALSDRTLSVSMKVYRQALRDITEQEGYPYNVVWPTKPEEVTLDARTIISHFFK